MNLQRASIRISSDIWHRRCGQELLLPSSALRIADHHLHASGVLAFKNNFDWFCVSQAVRCFAVNKLHAKSKHDAQSSLFVPNIGTSSIHFGNSLMLKDELLATTHRVFCRVKESTPAAFTDQERNKFLTSLSSTEEVLLPKLQRFNANDTSESELVLSVKVGPQHMNFANHVDHAFLAETAFHALHTINKESDEIAINYLGQPNLGDVLQCFVQGDKIHITRTDEITGESSIVVVAK